MLHGMWCKTISNIADTAAVYRNEEFIKETLDHVLPKHGLEPRDIFVTSKLGV